jgi:hypothetical protein
MASNSGSLSVTSVKKSNGNGDTQKNSDSILLTPAKSSSK